MWRSYPGVEDGPRGIMSDLADYFGPAATIALAVLALMPPSGQPRRWWNAAIIALGLLAAGASTYSIHSTKMHESDLRTWATGGDSYCYLKADLAAARSPSDLVPWWRVNVDGAPIEKLAALVAKYKPNLTRFDKEYWEFPNQLRGYRVCGVSPVWSGFEQGPGHYQIDISTPDKHFIEDLDIFVVDGKMKQSIVVTDEHSNRYFAASE